jgi:hypothetical protein
LHRFDPQRQLDLVRMILFAPRHPLNISTDLEPTGAPREILAEVAVYSELLELAEQIGLQVVGGV